MATKKGATTGRFGARYGRRLRNRVAEIESAMKQWHKCPYCNKKKVKRDFSGVWICKDCKTKFTGKAYLPE